MLWFENLGRRAAQAVFSPLVNLLAVRGVTPNQVTWVGFLSYGVVAWLLIMGLPGTAGVALAVLGPLDAIDGMLARKTGQAGNKGAFLDSTLDRYAEVLLFLGLLCYLFQDTGANNYTPWVSGDTLKRAYGNTPLLNALLVLAALSGSLLVSYARSRAESLGFSCKIGLMTRFERIFFISIALIFDVVRPALALLAVLAHLTAAQRIRHVLKQEGGVGVLHMPVSVSAAQSASLHDGK